MVMIHKLKVGQVMERPAYTVKPYDRAQAIAEIMLRNRLAHVPVVADERLVGLIALKELRNIWHYVHPDSLKVADVMNEGPYAVLPETPVDLVVRTIHQFRLDCAVVVDDYKRLLGVFTSASAAGYAKLAHRTSGYTAMAA